MFYAIYGTDAKKVHEQASKLVSALRAKKPDAAFVKIDKDTWTEDAVKENLSGQGLFSNKYIVLLDRVLENADAKDSISDLIAPMQESSNIFIMHEGRLNAEMVRTVKKYAEKTVECADPDFNPRYTASEYSAFSLADSMGERRVLPAWSKFRDLVFSGVEAESIAGTLFWQFKSMEVAAKSTSPASSGMAPFLYSKSKKYAANYSEEERMKLIKDLVALYHDAHRGLCDMEISLERLVLNCGKARL